MKHLQIHIPKRPQSTSAAVVRTSKEAAIRLVKLEFDAARLRQGIAAAEARAAVYQDDLRRNTVQRQSLLAILADTTPGDRMSP